MRPSLLLSTLVLGGLLAAGAATAEIAPSAKEIQPILVGTEVPDVPVSTLDGESISLVKDQRVVLIFYRGGW